MSYYLGDIFSPAQAQEQRLTASSIPPQANFSQVKKNEEEKTERFRCYVVAATEFGPRLKKEFALVKGLDSQINEYRRQIKKIRKNLGKASVTTSATLLNNHR